MNYLVITFAVLFSSQSVIAAKRYNFKSKLKSEITNPSLKSSSRMIANLVLSKKECESIISESLKNTRKTIKSYAIGSKISSADLFGASTRPLDTQDYGSFAKLGLPDDHHYQVSRLNTQYAIHADERCAKFAKVVAIDRTTYKSKSCRRVSIKLGKVEYKTFFCRGDRKAYVDHFGITKSI